MRSVADRVVIKITIKAAICLCFGRDKVVVDSWCCASRPLSIVLDIRLRLLLSHAPIHCRYQHSIQKIVHSESVRRLRIQESQLRSEVHQPLDHQQTILTHPLSSITICLSTTITTNPVPPVLLQLSLVQSVLVLEDCSGPLVVSLALLAGDWARLVLRDVP
jgi:hypothetical protein